jgi:hypothetical protein
MWGSLGFMPKREMVCVLKRKPEFELKEFLKEFYRQSIERIEKR